MLYGNIRFQNVGPGLVQIGDDTYNFTSDPNRNFARNAETLFLKQQSGQAGRVREEFHNDVHRAHEDTVMKS
jgi:hypothetical protein